jgi:hypothetical protein
MSGPVGQGVRPGSDGGSEADQEVDGEPDRVRFRMRSDQLDELPGQAVERRSVERGPPVRPFFVRSQWVPVLLDLPDGDEFVLDAVDDLRLGVHADRRLRSAIHQ